MTTVERLCSVLGPPQALREVTDDRGFLGAVGRWSHRGAKVDLRGTDTVQIIFNVSGGQRVKQLTRAGSVHQRTVRAGSIAITAPDHPGQVEIQGRADTVQIILSRKLLASVAGEAALARLPAPFRQARLQVAAVRALMCLSQGQSSQGGTLEDVLRQVAAQLADPVPASAREFVKGGLSPWARRRIRTLMEARLRSDGCGPLSVVELAQAAGLSVHHFIKAHRETEGDTPHRRVVTNRLDLALSLLLRTNARVDWIAMDTGFSSPAHFVSAFRKHFGTTPGMLRDTAVGSS